MVVAALLHDIGDELAPYNHCEVAAAILRPYVSERTYWVVKYHGEFQAHYYAHHHGADPNTRDRHRDSPHYQACVDFCEKWDQEAFDPKYQSLPVEFFEPMVRRIFAREPFKHDRAYIGSRRPPGVRRSELPQSQDSGRNAVATKRSPRDQRDSRRADRSLVAGQSGLRDQHPYRCEA